MSTTPAARRRRAPRPAKPAGAPALAAAPDPVSIPDLFRKGRSIAQIARDQKIGQDAVRAALTEAEIDFSADKNAQPVGAPKPPAPPKEKAAWSLLGSFDSILAKTPAKGSKREQVLADLASDDNTAALQAISLRMQNATDRQELARLANGLNAALSAHYARV